MSINWKRFFCAACVIAAAAGCSKAKSGGLAADGGGQSAQRAFVVNPGDESPVSGVWSGYWLADKNTGRQCVLQVTCIQNGPNEWNARFDAQCGRNASFQFDIAGRKEGDKVVFDESVDLGPENGGVFHWRGEVDAKEFNGRYENPRYQGEFILTKDQSHDLDALSASSLSSRL